jgi:transcriptional regulator with AAA-type ATPase domain/predicted hydrocarbon binding protein
MVKIPSSNSEIVTRISLKEASQKAPAILSRGDSLKLDEGAPPTLNDLAGALQFALGDGRIWLNDERMALMQTHVLGKLQARMINDIGMARTRDHYMRVGWEEGVALAELMKTRFKQEDLTAALAAGPRLHTMEGFAKVVTKRFEFDAAKQEYLGEFYWFDSVEGGEHLRNFGICDTPACWMQTGVPSGYSSTLLGFPVIFREIECVAQGADRCVVVGKDAESWGDDVPELALFDLAPGNKRKAAPWQPPTSLPIPDKRRATAKDAAIGTSPAIQRVKRLVEKVSAFVEPVMFVGEAGTGKEHFARLLHGNGPMSTGPFVAVNCSAYQDLPPDQDPFFAADGFAQQAKGGTLFLNDFTSLSLGIQAKLAAHMREGQSKTFEYRIVAATGDAPKKAAEEGRLRTDLHYFLSVLPIQLPPLRDRRDDLPELIQHFLDRHLERHPKALSGLSGGLYDMLLRYDYPGNLHELSNLIERGIIFAEAGGMIDSHHVFSAVENAPKVRRRLGVHGSFDRPRSLADAESGRTLEDIEAEAIQTALEENEWNVSATARALGLTRAKLDYRIKRLGLRQALK